MTPALGTATSTHPTRQPRIQIPSALPSLLQTELLFLDRLLRKNKPQHRSSIFFQKSTHVLRLTKRLAAVIDEVVKVTETVPFPVAGKSVRMAVADGGRTGRDRLGEVTDRRRYKTLVELVDKTVPAITKAAEVLEKMINHLHFLPLITTLLAITSRMFVITIDIAAYLLQYRDATQNSTGSGSSTPVTGSAREKEKDKVSFSFEEVVDMVVRGQVMNGRITTAQEQLRTRLEAIAQQGTQEKGKERSAPETIGGDGGCMLEMDGEDFGEAVGESIARTSSPGGRRKPTISQATPIILDPPSSPDEPPPARTAAVARPLIPGLLDAIEEPVKGKGVNDVHDTVFSLDVPPEKGASKSIAPRPERTKRPIEIDSLADPPPSKKKTPVERKAPRSTTGDTAKVKKKKGKDAMDDIFGL